MPDALVALLQSLPDAATGESQLLGYARSFVNFGALALVAFVLYRSRSSEVIQGEMKAWREKAERLQKEKDEKVAENTELSKQLADCQAKTDLTALRAEIKDGQLANANMQRELLAAMQEISRAVLNSQSHAAATFESLQQMIREGRLVGG